MTSRLLGLALLLSLLFLYGGCCATNQLWNFVRDDPVRLESASITEDDVLHMAVRYEFGQTWHLTAPLRRGAEFPHTEVTRVGILGGELPPTTRPMTFRTSPRGQEDVSVYHMWTQDKSAELEHTVWIEGQGFQAMVSLPTRVDWSSGLARVGLLLTPLALALDAVTAPIWIGWCVLTAGCHGPCPLPWCNERVLQHER